MKASAYVCLIGLAAAALASRAAFSYDASNSPAKWQSDEAEIRQMLDASVQAFNRGDLPGHLAISMTET